MTSLYTHRYPGTGRPIVFLHGLASSGGKDWPDIEWSETFDDRPRIVIDLPSHGASPVVGVTPTNGVLDLIADAIVGAVGSDEIDLVGYSLGSRLAWDLAQRPSMSARRLVLGGLAAGEPFEFVDLDAARSALAGGAAPADPLTGMILQMALLPGNDSHAVLDLIQGLALEPFDPSASGPVQPMLLVGGIDDDMAAGIDDLAALLSCAHTARVPGDHRAALHSLEFRDAAREFLAD